MLAPDRQVAKARLVANTLLWVILVMVLVVLLLFLFAKMVSSEQISPRLISSACSIGLFFVKFGVHLRWGPKGSLDKKLRTFGADLAFASMSFDITMALGQIVVPNLLASIVVNTTAFYVIAGVGTLTSWAFFFYPSTVANTEPNHWVVLVSSLLGVILYFGRLFLYF